MSTPMSTTTSTPVSRHRRSPAGARRQRGIAALAVVMVLFFIVSMVAAYTSRNLIFEQRTSANQYASSQAMDAAEAGLEWALAKVNQGRVDAACAASTDTADPTFRERYLAIDAGSGVITALAATATCVWNGADWDCRCPAAGNELPTAPSGDGIFPAFRVRFWWGTGSTPGTPPQPGVITLEANGCTRLDANCLSFGGQGVANEGRTIVRTLVALASALPRPPAAALTARGNVDLGDASIHLVNVDGASNGILVQQRGPTLDAGPLLTSLPGVPTNLARITGDLTLPDTADRYFSSFFNLWPQAHRQQPAAIAIDCAPSCDAVTLRAAASANPGRTLWATGDVVLDTPGDIGSPTAPLVLVVEGNLVFAAGTTVHGVVYARNGTWTTSGAGGTTIRGALVAEGDVDGTGTATVVYDRAVIDRLRLASGSIVRVPGGWRDF